MPDPRPASQEPPAAPRRDPLRRRQTRRRIGAAFTVLASLLPVAATAFQGDEHEVLSNRALLLALDARSAEVTDEGWRDLRAAIEGHLLIDDDKPTHPSFGERTRAVDWFLDDGRLYSDVCAGAGGGCHEQELERLVTLIGDRRSKLLRPLIAAHQNGHHFSADAVERYNRIHRLAIRQASAAREAGRETAAGASALVYALHTEAVALHFLQDFLAPGHLMTRRGVHEDLAARSLHNRFNARGMEGVVGDLSDLRPFLDLLEERDDGSRGNDGLASGGHLRLYGDGRLDRSESRAQSRLLLLLSAASVADVLAAAVEPPVSAPRSRLALCHRRWSAQPEERRSRERIDWPDLWSTCPPWGVVARLEDDRVEGCWRRFAEPSTSAPSDDGGFLLAYPRIDCPTSDCAPDSRGTRRENYVHWTPGLSVGLQWRLSGEETRGDEDFYAWDLDVPVTAITIDEIEKRDGCDYTGESFDLGWKGKIRAQLFYVGYSESRRNGTDTRLFTPFGGQIHGVLGKRDVNTYLRWNLSWAQVERPGRGSSAKPSAGLRWGLGFGYAFAETGIHVGYVEDRPGHLEEELVWTAGLRVQYSLRP